MAAGLSAGIGAGFLAINLLQRWQFDFGLLFWPCGFRARTGYPCVTCGMTRSVLAFCRADLGAAFRMQPAAGFLCLMVLAVGGIALYVAVSGRMPQRVRQWGAEFRLKRFLLYLALILLAGWTVTLAQAFTEG